MMKVIQAKQYDDLQFLTVVKDHWSAILATTTGAFYILGFIAEHTSSKFVGIDLLSSQMTIQELLYRGFQITSLWAGAVLLLRRPWMRLSVLLPSRFVETLILALFVLCISLIKFAESPTTNVLQLAPPELRMLQVASYITFLIVALLPVVAYVRCTSTVAGGSRPLLLALLVLASASSLLGCAHVFGFNTCLRPKVIVEMTVEGLAAEQRGTMLGSDEKQFAILSLNNDRTLLLRYFRRDIVRSIRVVGYRDPFEVHTTASSQPQAK